MGISNLTLYNNLRGRIGERESHELIEFIHSEIKVEMETVKSHLDTKTNVFLTKEDKIDLIDRMDVIKNDLIDRINKIKTDMIVWIVGVSVLQYILLMITRKFF
jgi:hypothetical protein